jgi:hypothetical protein
MPAFEPLATFQMLTELLQFHACQDATRYDSRTPNTSAPISAKAKSKQGRRDAAEN